jgi:hypothetical protein
MLSPRKVFTAKTGNGSSEVFTAQWYPDVAVVLALTYGSTPTVTVALEGSLDGTNWVSLTGATYTTGTPKNLEKPVTGWYLYYRITLTANTNVTVDAWIGAGGC